jgi:hypothetical protein
VQTRRSVSAKAKVCSTIATMHFQISGSKMFRQPGHATELTRRERDEIATFGHTSTRLEEAYVAGGGFATEDWLLQEESISGLRIARPATSSGGRYAHTQLIAVRPADSRHFLVGAVRWLKIDEIDTLHVGVRIVPGVPRAVAVRLGGTGAQAEKFVPALYCPALPVLATPASLILPLGWYRPRRVLEVYSDASELLLLSGVLERGSDYDRVAVEPPP